LVGRSSRFAANGKKTFLVYLSGCHQYENMIAASIRKEDVILPLDGSVTGNEYGYICERKPCDWSRWVSLKMAHLLAEFEISLVREGKSPTTVRKYRKDLRQFFNEKKLQRVADITKENIHDWILTLRTKGCGTGYIGNHLWAIKSFLSFVKREKGVACYEFDIRIPRVPAPETVEFLEIAEVDQLFSLLDIEDICDLRLRTFIEVMVNTGMRPSEALSLQRADLASQPEEIEIVGKGKKKRNVYFSGRCHYWINCYLSRREDNHPALFVTHNGSRETRGQTLRSAEAAFQQVVIKSGIKRRIVLHTLRHTFATQYMANGCPPDYVARLLGHSSTKTTRRYYLAVTQKHAKKAYFDFNPFGERSSYIISNSPARLVAGSN
jgi:site-specific recombinase XerD